MEKSDSLKAAIVSYYEGKLTQSQAEELLTWVHDSGENLDYFRQLGEVWHATSLLGTKEYDSIAALKETREKIGRRDIRTLPERVIHLRLSTLYKIAAAIIIVCALTFTGELIFRQAHPSPAPSLFVETSAPKGSRSFITLPDGTTVWLNADTKFRYAVDYGTANRTVYLEGEAYFKVSKNKKLPFKVFTSDITVTALGTAFNVKAYQDEATIETTLEEGLIRIEDLHASKQGKTLQPVILKPKQSAVFHKQFGNLAVEDISLTAAPNEQAPRERLKSIPMKVNDVADTRLYTSWKDPRWIFKNEKLSSLVVKLERRYAVDIVFMDKTLEDYAFTGTLEEESLEQVLSAIRYTAPIRYEINAKYVELYEDKKIVNQYKNIVNQ